MYHLVFVGLSGAGSFAQFSMFSFLKNLLLITTDNLSLLE